MSKANVRAIDVQKYVETNLIGKTIAEAELLVSPIDWSICETEANYQRTGSPVTRDVDLTRIRVATWEGKIIRFDGVG